MPWTAKDAEGHSKKANTPKKQKTWAKVANTALKRCLAQDRGQEECEASAIKQANSVVANIKEGTTRGYFTSGTATVEINALDVDGEKVPVSELVAVYQHTEQPDGLFADVPNPCLCLECGREFDYAACPECGGAMAGELSEAKTKTIDGKPRPKDDFLVVEDPDKPSTWHLPVKVNGKLDRKLAGAAWAALHGGYRGNKYEGPDKSAAVKKLKAIYKAQNWETPGMKEVEIAEIDKLRGLLEEALALLDEQNEELNEAQLSESASGHAIALAETQAVTAGPRAPLLMDVALIKPGWGNKKDNHYYSPAVLKRDAKVFEGAKMYATDHKPDQKSVRTEVSVIKGITGFTDDGAPIASVAVHDPDFAEATRNRKKLGTLETLECSILATGRTKKGKVDGRKGNIVEAIMSASSVDWVTKAGAGGHAIALAENSTGGDDMSEEEQTTTQEQEQEEETQEATLQEDSVTYLEESAVKEFLEASRLPKQAQSRLAEANYLDTEALKTVIESERQYIKEITGSGKPFAQGDTTSVDGTMSEAEYNVEYDNILRRHSIHVPQREA